MAQYHLPVSYMIKLVSEISKKLLMSFKKSLFIQTFIFKQHICIITVTILENICNVLKMKLICAFKKYLLSRLYKPYF